MNLPAGFYETGFAEAPQSLLQSCGEKIAATSSYKYWIFASTQTKQGRYIALGGVIRDPGGPWTPNKFGVLVFQEANQSPASCVAISWPLDVFCTPNIGGTPGSPVSQATLNGLANDAVSRYIKAFGSKAKFVAALNTQHRMPQDPKLAFLAAAIDGAPPH